MSQVTGRHSHTKNAFPDKSRTVTSSAVGLNSYKEALDVNLANVGALTTRIQVDGSVSTTTYIGKATPGTAAGTAAWQIKRISVSGALTLIQWADGDIFPDNVWDNRESLSYS